VPSQPGRWPEFYAGLERSLREGSPPPVNPDAAVAGLAVIDAARESAATGTVVGLA
jgi:predicted dehydrogenase